MNLMKMVTSLCCCFVLGLYFNTLTAQVIDKKTIAPGRTVIELPPQQQPPDTLDFGNFTLIVDSFETTGSWNAATMTFEHLSGTGVIKFGCQPPALFAGAKIQPNLVEYSRKIDINVVDTVKDAAHEISLGQIKNAGVAANVGDKFQVVLKPGDVLSNGSLQQILANGFFYGPPGATYRFTNVTATVTGGGTFGVVKTGLAQYPASSSLGSFTLNVSPGFQLQVSAVSIAPGQDAQVTAVLTLPPSLSGPGAYGRAQLNLGVISLTNQCEFYKEVADSAFGTFGVGNTTLGISGKGFVADFSSTAGYPGMPQLPGSWKGVVLVNGSSKGTPGDSVISNTGYLQANYVFSNGIVQQNGLSTVFSLASPYAYITAQPLGYVVSFDTAKVEVISSAVNAGYLKQGRVFLPKRAALQANNAPFELLLDKLEIRQDLNVYGTALADKASTLCWGNLVSTYGGMQKSFGVSLFSNDVLLYFSATPQAIKRHFDAGSTLITDPNDTLNLQKVALLGMQGATFTGFSKLFVNSPQSPGSFDPLNMATSVAASHLVFELGVQSTRWLNVGAEGVDCNIHAAITHADTVFVGNPSQSLYGGGTAFTIQPVANGSFDAILAVRNYDSIMVQSVESAVINCNYEASLSEPQPTGGLFKFSGMVFTSTANVAGGEIKIALNDSLSYWGLQLAAKPGFTSGGALSVRTGQIILTASGLSETRHFSQPFWLTWGEILANGSVGQLFFDYNSANQQFDKLNFVTTNVALSPYSSQAGAAPYLHVGGNIHFPFFGATFLNIKDGYMPDSTATVYKKRYIVLGDMQTQGIPASNRNIAGNWRDGLGIFKFTLSYDSTDQNGFLGLGSSNLQALSGLISSSIMLNSMGQCIKIGTDTTQISSTSLGPVANVSSITQIWGCACIMNDDISNVVVGGSVMVSANVSISMRAGAYLSSIMQITPDLTRYTLDGEASLSLMASLDAEINGHMQLTLNKAQGYVDGELNGDITMAEGTGFDGLSVDAQGQLDWHMGKDYQSIQGAVSLTVMGVSAVVVGSGVNAGAGFYIGLAAPKADAWVLTNTDPQYGLNTSVLPDNLTGFYGYLHLQQGVSLFVISGQYDLYVGFGAFVLSTQQQATSLGGLGSTLGLPYFIGNVGGGINGEILGGLVSAGANFDLQIVAPYPFSFKGTVGLQGCVVWFICGSVELSIELNPSQGFHVKKI